MPHGLAPDALYRHRRVPAKDFLLNLRPAPVACRLAYYLLCGGLLTRGEVRAHPVHRGARSALPSRNEGVGSRWRMTPNPCPTARPPPRPTHFPFFCSKSQSSTLLSLYVGVH